MLRYQHPRHHHPHRDKASRCFAIADSRSAEIATLREQQLQQRQRASSDVNYHVYSSTQLQPQQPQQQQQQQPVQHQQLLAAARAEAGRLRAELCAARTALVGERSAAQALAHEWRKVMSERDDVHEEIRQLTLRCERSEVALAAALEERDRLRQSRRQLQQQDDNEDNGSSNQGYSGVENKSDGELFSQDDDDQEDDNCLVCVDIGPIIGGSCGFTLSDSADGCHRIVSVQPGGPADRGGGRLRLGDRIRRVNGADTAGRSVEAVVAAVLAAAPTCQLAVSRRRQSHNRHRPHRPAACTAVAAGVCREVVSVRGRLSELIQLEAGFYIKQLSESLIGQLALGDRLLAVDDCPLDGLGLAEAHRLLSPRRGHRWHRLLVARHPPPPGIEQRRQPQSPDSALSSMTKSPSSGVCSSSTEPSCGDAGGAGGGGSGGSRGMSVFDRLLSRLRITSIGGGGGGGSSATKKQQQQKQCLPPSTQGQVHSGGSATAPGTCTTVRKRRQDKVEEAQPQLQQWHLRAATAAPSATCQASGSGGSNSGSSSGSIGGAPQLLSAGSPVFTASTSAAPHPPQPQPPSPSPSPSWRYVWSEFDLMEQPAPRPPPPGPRLAIGRHDLLLLGPPPHCRGRGGGGGGGWRFAWQLDPGTGARIRGGFVPSVLPPSSAAEAPAAGPAGFASGEESALCRYYSPVDLVPNAGSGGPRPVVLLGSHMADAVVRALADLRPGEFCCLPPAPAAAEASTAAASAVSIAGRVAAESNRHCLLSLQPCQQGSTVLAFIERLHNLGVYPIVLLLHLAARSIEDAATSGSLLPADLRPVLTAVIDCPPGADFSRLCLQVSEAISRHQFGPVWVRRPELITDHHAHY